MNFEGIIGFKLYKSSCRAKIKK